MKSVFLFSSMIFSAALALADPHLTPHFENTPDAFPASSFNQNTEIKNFRVLVFPHFGPYAIPQGKESSASSVVITTAGECVAHPARLDENHEWVAESEVLSTSGSMTIQAEKVANVYYDCSKPFKVLRTSPLQSFEYSGDFVSVTDGKTVSIINIVDVETYLKGVIPSEVEASWPVEVLKAQAIAARTYAWFSVLVARARVEDPTKRTEPNSPLYDMDDTVMFQAYSGNNKRTAVTDKAANDTEGLIMKHEGTVIKAYFSGDSGGFSENSAAVFGAELPYCKARKETYDISLSKTDWNRKISFNDLSVMLLKAQFIPTGTTVREVRVQKRTESGRVAELLVTASNGVQYPMRGPEFRYATTMRSTLFEVTSADQVVTFTGRGWGHGVGMAQVGALQYAKQLKWTFDQILKFYYTGVTITGVHE